MSIDDNHQNLSLIQQALEEHFDVISSTGDESVEELVIDCEPHIILLDIMLTNKSGYDVCRDLRDKGLLKNIYTIFISSLSSLNDKLKAYEVGGDDYICKPVDLAELEYKLEACEKRILEHRDLENQMEEVSQVAYASMQQSSEMGQLLEFFNQSLHIDQLELLGKAVKATTDKFQVNCLMEFRLKRERFHYPPSQISQLESEILGLGKRAKRVVPFGKNVLFNSKNCSLLIKNMPGNEEDLGRVRDHLAMLLEIISIRIQAIQAENDKTAKRQKNMETCRREIELQFSQANNHIQQMQQRIEVTFNQLQRSVKQELSGLPDNQQIQHKIDLIFDSNKNELKQLAENAKSMDFKLQDIQLLMDQFQ